MFTWAADNLCRCVSKERARRKRQKGGTPHYFLSNICMCAHKEEGRASSLAKTWDFFHYLDKMVNHEGCNPSSSPLRVN